MLRHWEAGVPGVLPMVPPMQAPLSQRPEQQWRSWVQNPSAPLHSGSTAGRAWQYAASPCSWQYEVQHSVSATQLRPAMTQATGAAGVDDPQLAAARA